VVTIATTGDGLPWNEIGAGLIPDFTYFQRPTAKFTEILQTKIESEAARAYWSNVIVSQQRDVMISAAATAVGINMTFLFPYSLLRKGWGKEYRGLSIFDLSTGMFIPYVLATGCVVIAASAQFHTKFNETDFPEVDGQIVPVDEFKKGYDGLIKARTGAAALAADEDSGREAVPVSLEEQKLAARLVKRDAGQLSESLVELTGSPWIANKVFGLGVLAMALSTISILMLISGFVFCEVLGFEAGGWPHRLGTLVAGIGGSLGPFFWSGASAYLAIPTSVIGFVLLPFAYITFVLLLNQKSLMGENRPKGFKRFLWIILTGIAATLATIGSVYMAYVKIGWYGPAIIGGVVVLALMVQINRWNERKRAAKSA